MAQRNSFPDDLPLKVWIILSEVALAMFAHHPGVIALNRDRLAICACFERVIDAFVQFDGKRRHVAE